MDRINGLMVIMIAMVVAMASPVTAPPALPTELDANLLNLNGSNIDVNLLLTVCYTDGDLNPACEYSTNFPGTPPWTWNIYLGKSNFYGLVPAKDGTNITLTVDGYEPVNVTAVEAGAVTGTYKVVRVLPTNININLLNLDGSNIDVNLLLTLCYLNSGLNRQCVNSTEFSSLGWNWSIYNGKSNLATRPVARNGTYIDITVEGYEMLQITAVDGGTVTGDYSLPDIMPPYNTTDPKYARYVFVNTTWNINITWADDHTNVSTAWLVRSDTGCNDIGYVKYFPDMNVTNGSETEFFWNRYNETSSGEINITACANDTIGNINNLSFTYNVINTMEIDLDPVQDYYNTTSMTISGNTSSMANVSYSLNNNGSPVSISNGTTNFSMWFTASEGLNNLTVYAVDYSNPDYNTSKGVSFYVDTIYPGISYNLDTTPSGAHSQDWIFVSVSADDNYGIKPGTLILDFNGTSNTSWDNSGTEYWINMTDNIIEGEYIISVSVEDLAGNINTTDPIIVVIDQTPPSIAIGPPLLLGGSLGGTFNDESIILRYNVSDMTSNVSWVGISLDDTTNQTGNLTGDTYTFDRLPDGQHIITIYANDSAGNMDILTVSFTMDNDIQGSDNARIDNNTFTCDSIYGGKCAIAIVNITGVNGSNAAGSLNITRFKFDNLSQAPGGIDPLNLTTTTTTGIYIRINHNLTNFSSALLRIYYNALDLDVNGNGNPGEPQIDIDPSKLWIYRYNGSDWIKLTSNRQVNQTPSGGYDGYIQANVTNFSYFSFAGGLIPTPPPGRRSGGGGGGGPYIPAFIPTVVLTSSTDWHYSMLAAGFAAANDYAVLVNPSRSLDLAVKNNIQWFRRLIIFGGESIISKDIENNFTYLKNTLEPGFFGMDIVRVNGSSFYDASTRFVDRWKDPDGKPTAKGIILTRGDAFVDTLVASQLSGAASSPIIYTEPTRLLPWARDKIQELGLDVTIIGGEKAISPEVEDAIKALGVNVTRISGKDRYETAALVADEYIKAMEKKGKTVDTITFLSGDAGDWAGTLGAWSYERNSVILLVKNSSKTDEFPKVNKDFIAAHPDITSASIWVESDGNIDDFASTDSYLRSIGYDVDSNKGNSYQMNRGNMEKDYNVQLNPVSLSTSVTGDIRKRLKNKGTMLIAGKGAGGGGGSGGDGGEPDGEKYEGS